MANTGRRNTKNTRRSDAVLGIVIPGLFVGLAVYQELHDRSIDKYVIGVLLVFGLGALGWRVDILLEKVLEARNPPRPTIDPPTPPAVEPPSSKDPGHAAEQPDG